MTERNPEPMTPEAFARYRAEHRETDYLLVDVRQPGEYQAAHIPGAMFMPLMELESRLFELPDDRDLIFYCHSGGRSLAASGLAVEAEVTQRVVYNLEGGIMGYEGKTLPGYPRTAAFDRADSLPTLLKTAMDLEKGAWRFYRHVLASAPPESLKKTFETLAAAEIGHARTVYRFWSRTVENPPAFDDVYDSLGGDILEGGLPVETAVSQLAAAAENPCMDLIELALHIEYTAYDLYRTTADNSDDPAGAEALLTIAQAEKNHMRTLIKAIARCTDQ